MYSKLNLHVCDLVHMFLAYRKVNPSDCVDMDCDGHKKMLVEDMDGSFLPSGQVSTINIEVLLPMSIVST